MMLKYSDKYKNNQLSGGRRIRIISEYSLLRRNMSDRLHQSLEVLAEAGRGIEKHPPA